MVNCAGLFADEVSRIFGAEDYSHQEDGRASTNLLDKLTRAKPSRVVFPVPTSISKGMLVVPTVEGTRAHRAATARGRRGQGRRRDHAGGARDHTPQRPEHDPRHLRDRRDHELRGHTPRPSARTITSTRRPGSRPSSRWPAYNLPRLTASPAIGEYVKDLLKRSGLVLVEKPDWDPFLEKTPRVRDLSAFDLDALVAENPSYGEVVCRCERVTEAEIVAAIRRGHTTLDGIKYFTRAQMGRCQGGFCTYKIIKILMRETGMGWDEITKRGRASTILRGEL